MAKSGIVQFMTLSLNEALLFVREGKVLAVGTALYIEGQSSDQIDVFFGIGKPLSQTPGFNKSAIAQIAGIMDGTGIGPHTHSISQVINLTSSLAGKAPLLHNHDDRYYTETEVNGLISSHTHPDATTSTAGFMSAADKVLLDSIGDDAPLFRTRIWGGGKLTFNSDQVFVWGAAMRLDHQGRGSHWSTDGYFEIDPLPAGTPIDGVGGHPGAAATAVGVPMKLPSSNASVALYYELPIGAAHDSVSGNFKLVANGIDDYTIPANWVWLASKTDSATPLLHTALGVVLRVNDTIDMTKYYTYSAGESAVDEGIIT